MTDKIQLYKAIQAMKDLSDRGDTFSIAFRKYNRQTRRGGALVRLDAVRCRPKAADEDVENSSHKLYLTDTTTGRALVCWQILVTEFNGQQTVLD